MGEVATCNFDGAAKDRQKSKWRPEYGDVLRGADVIVIADCDEPGIAHAKAVAADLNGKARSVVIMLPAVAAAHADVSDHLDAGFTLDDLAPLPVPEPQLKEAAPSADGDGDGKRSQASRLVELAITRFNLVVSEDGRPYGVVKNGPNIA